MAAATARWCSWAGLSARLSPPFSIFYRLCDWALRGFSQFSIGFRRVIRAFLIPAPHSRLQPIAPSAIPDRSDTSESRCFVVVVVGFFLKIFQNWLLNKNPEAFDSSKMKMLKQRFRERSESWLNSTTDRGPHPAPPPPPPPPVGEPHNPPVSILSHSTTTSGTNGQLNSSSVPVIEHPPQQAAHMQQHHDRPRKKLSFRDPEVTSMAGKEGAASDHPSQPHLAMLKDQGFSDSMENVDLEVVFHPVVVLRLGHL